MVVLPDCAVDIAAYYEVPIELLAAVRIAEGGELGSAGPENGDGSRDLGPMQINEWWLPRLQAFGITRDDVLNNECTNLAVGAWILSSEQERFADWYLSIAAYNVGADDAEGPVGQRYMRRVVGFWWRIHEDNSVSYKRRKMQ